MLNMVAHACSSRAGEETEEPELASWPGEMNRRTPCLPNKVESDRETLEAGLPVFRAVNIRVLTLTYTHAHSLTNHTHACIHEDPACFPKELLALCSLKLAGASEKS